MGMYYNFSSIQRILNSKVHRQILAIVKILNILIRYDYLRVGYPWNSTFVAPHDFYDHTGDTYSSDVIVHFTSDGSVNNLGFLLQFYSGN